MQKELSQTQRDILGLLAQCDTYESISQKLGLSIKTIYNNVSILMPKVGVQKREQLIRYAQEQGYGKMEATPV
jgi:DNA-binding NarL/FixJ family response regulator